MVQTAGPVSDDRTDLLGVPGILAQTNIGSTQQLGLLDRPIQLSNQLERKV